MYGEPELKRDKLLKALHLIDSKLNTTEKVIFCGTTCIQLPDIDFRMTSDIDFTVAPSQAICDAINMIAEESGISLRAYDTNAPGVVCLLDDYEDRLEKFEDGFKFLEVYYLSILDWVVSKFEAPKIDDLIDHDIVDADFIEAVEEHMYKYAGRDIDRARSGLRHVLSGRRIKEDLLSRYTMEQIEAAWEHLTPEEQKSTYKKMFAVHKYEQKLIDTEILKPNNT